MKNVFILMLTSILCISCSRDDDNIVTATTGESTENLVPVSISIETDKPRTNTIFMYSSKNFLQMIEYPDYDSGEMNFTYNNSGLITQVALNAPRNGNPMEEKGVFTYDNKNNLIKEVVTHTTEFGKTEVVINYEIKNSTIIAKRVEKDYDTNGKINYTEESTITYTLDSQKRPYKSEKNINFSITGGNPQLFEDQINYSYHSDNYIYKNIAGFKNLTYSEFFFNAPNGGIYFGVKNYISSLEANKNYQTEITNNTSNYPNKITKFNNKGEKEQTYSIEYK